MRYFKSEYWYMINSLDAEERKEGEIKSKQASAKYAEYFDSIKDQLPKSYLKKYDQYHGFHDFEITNICMICSHKHTIDVEIHLSFKNNIYLILFQKVSKFTSSLPEGELIGQDTLTWGYDEIEVDQNIWTMRVLCNYDFELEISFEKIKFKQLKPAPESD